MIPKLRFPEFEDSWNKVTIAQSATFRRGSFPQPYNIPQWYDDVNGMPFVQVVDVGNDFRLKPKTKQMISEMAMPKSVFVPKGSIVATIQGSIGRIALTQYDSYVDRTLLIITEKKLPLDDYFFIVSLKKIFDYEKTIAVGGTIKTITKEKLAKFKFSIPTNTEQKKIGDFIRLIDHKINLLTKKKEALEIYKKGLMQKIFSQELRFKREDGTDYPEWTSTKIGNHTFKISEKNKNLEPLPIYSISNKGGFVPQSEQFEGVDSSERGYDISMYKIVGKDTFAYNPARINVGSYGYSANLDRVQVSSLYVCFKVKPELSPIYLLYFMSSFKFNKSVLRNVEGGVRQYLFYDNFKNIRIPLPSLSEQEKIIKALKLLDGNLACLENAINKMQELKKGLLQQMFV